MQPCLLGPPLQVGLRHLSWSTEDEFNINQNISEDSLHHNHYQNLASCVGSSSNSETASSWLPSIPGNLCDFEMKVTARKRENIHAPIKESILKWLHGQYIFRIFVNAFLENYDIGIISE